MMITAFAVMLAVAPAAIDVGPEPTMEEFAALSEPAVSSSSKKSADVAFKWPYRLVKGPAGYYTCGLVGSRANPSLSEMWVSAVVANGRVVSHQTAASNGMLAYSCKKAVKRGELVPR